jgi:hypothetical protein
MSAQHVLPTPAITLPPKVKMHQPHTLPSITHIHTYTEMPPDRIYHKNSARYLY